MKTYLAGRDLEAQLDLGWSQAGPVRSRLACLIVSVSVPFLWKVQQAGSSVLLYGAFVH